MDQEVHAPADENEMNGDLHEQEQDGGGHEVEDEDCDVVMNGGHTLRQDDALKALEPTDIADKASKEDAGVDVAVERVHMDGVDSPESAGSDNGCADTVIVEEAGEKGDENEDIDLMQAKDDESDAESCSQLIITDSQEF